MKRKINIDKRSMPRGIRPCAFLLGGVSYMALETLWRGRTHPGMGVVGGTCMAAFCTLRHRHRGGLLSLCLRGSAMITAAELLYGTFLNRERTVWDYSELPLNWRGQICARYSFFWCLLCLPMCAFARLLERHLCRVDSLRRK